MFVILLIILNISISTTIQDEKNTEYDMYLKTDFLCNSIMLEGRKHTPDIFYILKLANDLELKLQEIKKIINEKHEAATTRNKKRFSNLHCSSHSKNVFFISNIQLQKIKQKKYEVFFNYSLNAKKEIIEIFVNCLNKNTHLPHEKSKELPNNDIKNFTYSTSDLLNICKNISYDMIKRIVNSLYIEIILWKNEVNKILNFEFLKNHESIKSIVLKEVEIAQEQLEKDKQNIIDQVFLSLLTSGCKENCNFEKYCAKKEHKVLNCLLTIFNFILNNISKTLFDCNITSFIQEIYKKNNVLFSHSLDEYIESKKLNILFKKDLESLQKKIKNMLYTYVIKTLEKLNLEITKSEIKYISTEIKALYKLLSIFESCSNINFSQHNALHILKQEVECVKKKLKKYKEIDETHVMSELKKTTNDEDSLVIFSPSFDIKSDEKETQQEEFSSFQLEPSDYFTQDISESSSVSASDQNESQDNPKTNKAEHNLDKEFADKMSFSESVEENEELTLFIPFEDPK